MPTVTVRLFADLRRYHPRAQGDGAFSLEVEDGATVGRLIEILGIPRAAVRVTFVNGSVVDESRTVREGDEVGIFPPIAGGSAAGQGGAVGNAGLEPATFSL